MWAGFGQGGLWAAQRGPLACWEARRALQASALEDWLPTAVAAAAAPFWQLCQCPGQHRSEESCARPAGRAVWQSRRPEASARSCRPDPPSPALPFWPGGGRQPAAGLHLPHLRRALLLPRRGPPAGPHAGAAGRGGAGRGGAGRGVSGRGGWVAPGLGRAHRGRRGGVRRDGTIFLLFPLPSNCAYSSSACTCPAIRTKIVFLQITLLKSTRHSVGTC